MNINGNRGKGLMIATASLLLGSVAAVNYQSASAGGLLTATSLGNGRAIRSAVSLSEEAGNLYAASQHKEGEGKCGEGRCGDEPSKDKSTEGKCGEGKCGGDAHEKSGEGKCGEGKCGGKD